MTAETPGPDTELGQYRVIRPLGRGGRAEVFLARDLQLGRKVALKLARTAADPVDPSDQDPRELERLLDEARATARLSHPNIVTIFGVGAHQGRPYLALEFVEGETLRDRLDRERERGGAPRPQEGLRVAHAICLALEHAHGQGVLHRDLKPENVILAGDGRPRVLDFGLALLSQDRDSLAGAARQGTPPYMAPEQWRGEGLGPATDIWALGVVLHELLVGRRPYPDLPLPRLREEVLAPRPVPLSPQLHEGARPLVGRCLDKSPEGRPTAHEAARELERLLRQAISAPGRNPYPGLRPFAAEDAPLFFGRQGELSAFVELLRHETLLAVVGPSGAGKTSFLHAGVIPRLGEQPGWLVLPLRPGPRPLEALARALAGTDDAAGLAALLREAPAMLGLVLEQLARDRCDQLLLLVDQLEELAAAVDPAEGERFVEAVCLAADDPAAPVRVVLALRDDWISRLAVTPGIRAAVSRMRFFLLGSPAPPALRQVLEGPLAALGCRFESPQLVDEMVSEVEREAVSLPLLQFAAHRIWERRDSAGVLRRADYLAIGGVAGALADHGDAVLAALPPSQVDVARQLLLRLVTPQGTRRILAETELLAGLAGDAPRVLERLVEGRLVVVRRGDLDPDGHPVHVELVHESLIERWTCLSRWLQASRGRLALTEEVEQAAGLWDRRGRPSQELWHGDALAEALPLLQPGDGALTERAQGFLREGKRHSTAAARLRLGLTLAVLGLAAVLAMLLSRSGAPGTGRRAPASEQPEVAVRRWAETKVRAAGAALLAGNLVRARAEVRASLEALDTARARVLWWRLDREHLLWKRSLGTDVLHLAFGADGRTLAAEGADGTLRLLDPATGGRRASLQTDPTLALAVAGDRVAAATRSGQLLLWSIGPGRDGHPRPRVLQAGAARALALADGGTLLAAALEDGTIRIWRVPSLALQRTLRAPEAVALAFDPGGRMLAVAGGDRVLLWQIAGRAGPRQLIGHAGVRALSFSPDGQRLASGCSAGTVRVWSTRTDRVEQVITRAGPTRSLVFATDRLLLGVSGDGVWAREIGPGQERELLQLPRARVALDRVGRRVAAAHGNTLQLWSLTAGPAPVERGHRGAVLDVSLDPKERVLASAGADGTVRLWDPATGEQRDVLLGHVGPVRSVSLHPDGLHLASGGDDGTVRAWSLERGVEIQILSPRQRRILAVRHSPEGDRVAWGGSDGSVGIWRPETGDRQLLGRHRAAVLALAFSPDGALVASAGADRTARLWRVADGRLTATLVGHRSRVTAVAFVGEDLVTGSDDRTVRAWRRDGRPGPTLLATVGPGGRLASLRRGVAVASQGRPLQLCAPGDGWSCRALPGAAARVNALSASSSGLLAVAREDGTVGLRGPHGPVWRAPLLLPGPATLLGHRGWIALASPTAPAGPPRSRWARSVTGALAASASPTRLCGWNGEQLELWDREADRRLWRQALDGVSRVLVVPGGCLTLAGGVARLHGRQGAKELVSPAAAIAAGPGALLAASRREVVRFDDRGRRIGSHPGIGVTALRLAGEQLTLGFADGSVELLRQGTSTPAPVRLRTASTSPVTALEPGPLGTLFVGQAGGELEGWLPDAGSRFYRGKLHGPVTHLLVEDGRLFAASSVGDHLGLDLEPLRLGYCQLLRRVWQRVRVLWEREGAVIRGPPRGHRCGAARP